MSFKDESEHRFQPWVDAVKKQQPTEDEYLNMETKLMQSIEDYDGPVYQDEPSQGKLLSAWSWLKELSVGAQWGFAGSFAIALSLSVGLLFSGGVSSPAFASVVQKLNNISSMIYAGEMLSNGEPIMSLEVFYKAPSKLRIVNTPLAGGNKQMSVVNVLDTELGEGLIIFPHVNRAMPFSFSPGEQSDDKSIEDSLLDWHKQVLSYKGEVIVTDPQLKNGQMLVGYVIDQEHMDITLWVDPNTELPKSIRIEIAQGQNSFIFDADVAFNQYLDDELFSTSSDNYNIMTEDGDE
ncbi:LolA family protein [Ningiella sp. W23]|uniref:LolA family protein n=1 Tax=Ningiella sp. W23 TaxID=3023715 RepID=UPI003757FB6F